MKAKLRPSQLILLLTACMLHRRPILITGSPGIGKSDIVAQVCKQIKMRKNRKGEWVPDPNGDPIHCEIMHPVISDPTDFKGFPFVIDGKAVFLPFNDLDVIIKADRPMVVFLDDLGQAPASVQAAVMQLLLARRINGHKVSPYVTFVAATNFRTDRAGVSGMLETVKSRFMTIVELMVNVEDWTVWAQSTGGIREEVVAYVNYKKDIALHDFKPTADMTNSVCPRTVANVSYILDMGLPREISEACISGAVGEGWSVEFAAFQRTHSQLPDLDTFMANPRKELVPKQVDALYAFTIGIAYRANADNFDQIYAVANLIPLEFSAFLVSNVMRRYDVMANPLAIRWAQEHRQIASQ